MDEKPVDRRVRKTKRQLRLALMQLMSEKNVKDISVRELAAIADINRGTFYIHYKDVYDLLSQLEEEMAQGLIKVCRSHHAQESSGSTFPYLNDLYRFIQENSDLCRVLLGANGDKAYTDRICRILRDDHLYDFVSNFHKDADPTLIDYFCAFIISGNLSLALRWIATGMQETPDEMATLAGKIITQGVQVLSKEAGE
jgi:AcrR family transcriptional regulator